MSEQTKPAILTQEGVRAFLTNTNGQSALIAKQYRRIDDLEFSCIQAANALENGMPEQARKVLLRAIGAPERVL